MQDALTPTPSRYPIQDILQQTPVATLYLALDPDSQQTLVLKCFKPDAQNHYLREISVAFGHQHPNILTCLDTFYDEGKNACIVYEYLVAGSLRDKLNDQGRLSVEQTVRCLRDLLQALSYLHSQNIIHCDIKPENVLLRRQANDTFQYILGDLGAAANLREAQESHHTTASPAYVAPERLYERFTFNSDLYSLGILAFELLTGDLPFHGSTMEIAQAHLSQIPPLDLIEPAYLREFVAYLLEKDATARLSNTQEALRLLARLQQTYVPTQTDVFITSSETPKQTAAADSPQDCNDIEQQKNHNWQPKQCYSQVHNAEKLLILQKNQQPWFVLGVQNHREVYVNLEQEAKYLLLNVSSTCVLQNNNLAYSSGQKLYCLSPAQGQRQLLTEVSRRLMAFDYCNLQQRLVFCDGHSVNVKHLAQQKNYYYPLEHYVLEPKVCLFNQDQFAHIGGYMDHCMTLRQDSGEVLQRWFLDGPILECTQAKYYLLVLTMNLEHNLGYSLWRLDPNGSKVHIQLPANSEHHCVTPGHVFWLEQDLLHMCDNHLQPRLVTSLHDNAIQLFSITPDHRFLAVASTADSQSQQLTISVWENT